MDSELPPFFTQSTIDILETFVKLDYSLHSLTELLDKPQDMIGMNSELSVQRSKIFCDTSSVFVCFICLVIYLNPDDGHAILVIRINNP